MIESPPSVFKRGWEMLWEQPGAYFVVAILPPVAAIGLPILVGRLVVRLVHREQEAPMRLNKVQPRVIRLFFLAVVALRTKDSAADAISRSDSSDRSRYMMRRGCLTAA
jgi:hypothetical protein